MSFVSPSTTITLLVLLPLTSNSLGASLSILSIITSFLFTSFPSSSTLLTIILLFTSISIAFSYFMNSSPFSLISYPIPYSSPNFSTSTITLSLVTSSGTIITVTFPEAVLTHFLL